MATTIVNTVGNNAKDINAWESKGRKSVDQVYAATSIPLFATGAAWQVFNYAQLTGAMTINAATTIANLTQWDEVVFVFEADASQRIVTFGTAFVSSGTLTITAAKGATVHCIFDGTNLRVTTREIYA